MCTCTACCTNTCTHVHAEALKRVLRDSWVTGPRREPNKGDNRTRTVGYIAVQNRPGAVHVDKTLF